jgi:hypothetical protein
MLRIAIQINYEGGLGGFFQQKVGEEKYFSWTSTFS